MTAGNISAKHAFTTRFGGVSKGIWSSLNLGENRGDDTGAVKGNYRRIFAALEMDPDRAVFSKQVHGTQVRVVTAEDARHPYEPFPWEADGLVTAEKGLALIIFTADCVPVLLHDAKSGVIGAVHCGWRSTAGDIEREAIEKMSSLGAEPRRIQAAIGPSVGVCCFETGPEVPEALDAMLGGDSSGLFAPKPGMAGKYMTDLKGAVRRRLIQLGVPDENVSVSEECTICSSDKYWSHRATGGARGTQASIIVL